ncbi:MAG: single-stranded DNA-binding protein [Microthrixaceae bacterium]|nr:single-stranded DNA-binding protein [Microthrixaceae bacterium]
MSDTTVTVVGNTTRDVEIKFTNSGQAVGDFGIAVNKRVKGANGEWEDGEPEFYDVTLWGSHAENFAESCPRGTRVMVIGRLQFDTWEKDGEKRSKVKIVADHVGPDLRWATASVAKVQKGEGGAKPAPRRTTAPVHDDEAPF